MFLFGLIFLIAGIAGCSAFCVAAVASGEWIFLLGAFIFCAMFCGVGISTMRSSIKSKQKNKKILNEGSIYTAKIIGHQDGSGIMVNGVPPLDIAVSCSVNDEERVIVISTGEHSAKGYPIGAYCKIAILGVDCCLVPDSVTF